MIMLNGRATRLFRGGGAIYTLVLFVYVKGRLSSVARDHHARGYIRGYIGGRVNVQVARGSRFGKGLYATSCRLSILNGFVRVVSIASSRVGLLYAVGPIILA